MNAQISDVEIDGVQTLFVPGFGVALREGIALTTAFAEIAGAVEIKHNTIDGGACDNVVDLRTVNTGIGCLGSSQSTRFR